MKHVKLTIIVLFVLCSGLLHAQNTNKTTYGRAVELFPYPFKELSFLNARFDRVINDDDSYTNTYLLRGVTTFNRHYHVRADVPLVSTNSSGSTHFGLGDVDVRLTYTHRLHQRWYLGYGVQANFPTATHESLGTGKFVARPNVGVAYFRGKDVDDVTGTITLAAEYRFSYAGDSSRNKISAFALSPNIDWWFSRWYIGYYATWLYNFESEVFDLPLDIEAGYSILPHLTLAGEFVLPLLKDSGYKYEFLVKLRYDF